MQRGCFLLTAENERDRGIYFVLGLNCVETAVHALRGQGKTFSGAQSLGADVLLQRLKLDFRG